MGMSILFWHWEECDGQGGLEEHSLMLGGGRRSRMKGKTGV